MFAVIVRFTVELGELARLLPLVPENAEISRECEAGCHRFDVATDPDRRDEVLHWELYTDAAAFDDHLVSMHFRSFARSTEAMIRTKAIHTFREIHI